jgi:hypothetical protein
MRLAGLVWPRNLLSDLKNRRRSSGPIPLSCKEFERGLERHLASHVKILVDKTCSYVHTIMLTCCVRF